jgi:hypothetical protein
MNRQVQAAVIRIATNRSESTGIHACQAMNAARACNSAGSGTLANCAENTAQSALDFHTNDEHCRRRACDLSNELAGFFVMSKKTEIFDTFV